MNENEMKNENEVNENEMNENEKIMSFLLVP
jgi:hypothetical protein